jgi:D-alanyl-lipoteichoic acid acyltransferase DltB (MBOAT superfamily)
MRLALLLLSTMLIALGFSSWRDQTIRQVSIQEIDLTQSESGYSVSKKSPVVLPLQIGGGEQRALKLSFSGEGQARTLELAVLASRSDFEIIGPDLFPQRSGKCNPTKAGLLACSMLVKISPTQHHLTLMSPHSTQIQAINVTVLNVKRAVQTGLISVPTALCLLSCFAPLFWLSSARTGQLLICAIAASWLAAVDLHFFLATVTLLTIFLGLLRLIENSETKMRSFSALVLCAIAVLLFVKSILPLTAKFFANPGEMFMLPLGFSYFIIRIIDLAFKSYARQIKQLSALDYFAYILFPPTLAAGPIMSIVEFRSGSQFYTRFEDRAVGLVRILSGLTKKVLADAILAYLVTPNLASGFYGNDNRNVPLVLFASTLFVYLDFSAYSDMAIGVARWWGWKVPENFNFPFLRRSMREFWQNWHMSLTQWVTRHVFMQASMEVRRSPRWMQITLPTFTAMLTIGLWHGLEFVWVLWALHNTAGILIGDFLIGSRMRSALPNASSQKTAVLKWLQSAFGIVFVWYWFALSQAFTLTVSVPEALGNYVSLLSFGLA